MDNNGTLRWAAKILWRCRRRYSRSTWDEIINTYENRFDPYRPWISEAKNNYMYIYRMGERKGKCYGP